MNRSDVVDSSRTQSSLRVLAAGQIRPRSQTLSAFGEAGVDILNELDLPVQDAGFHHQIPNQIEIGLRGDSGAYMTWSSGLVSAQHRSTVI